jgi:hypothetical protein
MCFTYTLQEHVSKCFICLQSYVAFLFQVFYVVRPGASRGTADRAFGALVGVGSADKGAASRGTLRACSLAAHLGSRVSPARRVRERGGDQRKDRWA